MRTTLSKAMASPGCASTWARTAAAPVSHPALDSGFDTPSSWASGSARDRRRSVCDHYRVHGLSVGVNFCTTSAFFGGKGKLLNLYSTGANYSA